MNLCPLQFCLLLSSAIFCIGLAGVIIRSNAILVLLGIELMLNAANINLIAFWRFLPTANIDGVIFVIFSIAIAAAEAAVGLALIINIYRQQKNIRLPDANELKG